MKIAIIGPGIMKIPPKGWGAVEILIHNLSGAVGKLGVDVDVYNDANMEHVCSVINEKNYDFIHLQYDNHTEVCRKLLNKPFVVTTHYGFITNTRYWDAGYHQIHNEILQSPGIIALSNDIERLYLSHQYNKFLKVLRNGAEVPKFRWQERGNGRAICLGKIEPRKCQNLLSHHLGNLCPIDFVGPQAQPFIPNGDCRWVGEWTKEELYDMLTNYSCLVLISAGEAAPLVVPEALAAGLSVIVSQQAAANLPDRKFITVIDTPEKANKLHEYINGAIAVNNNYRGEIRKFAEEYFDWSVIAKEYLEIVNQWKAYCSSGSGQENTVNSQKPE